jgi:hypothetical protein
MHGLVCDLSSSWSREKEGRRVECLTSASFYKNTVIPSKFSPGGRGFPVARVLGERESQGVREEDSRVTRVS